MIKRFNSLFIKNGKAIDGGGRPKKSEFSSGICFYWAYVFNKVFGGKLITLISEDFSSTSFAGHAVVFYKGKYFDGDHPEGVGSIRDFNMDTVRVVRHRNLSGFSSFWKINKEVYKGTTINKIMDNVAKSIKKGIK